MSDGYAAAAAADVDSAQTPASEVAAVREEAAATVAATEDSEMETLKEVRSAHDVNCGLCASGELRLVD